MATKATKKTYEDSSGKSFSTHAAAAASNTSMGTNPSVNKSSGGSSGGSSSSSTPAYNAATGATSGKASPEYESYLKSLNKKGSSNYVPTPDDPGMENMDAINNAAVSVAPSINTTQPSPTTAAITPPNQPGQTPLTPGGALAGQVPAGADTDLASRARAGFDAMKASGVVAPQSSAQGAAMVASATPGAAQDMSSVDQQLAEDPGWQEIEQMRKDYFDPHEQKSSLMDTYKKLYKQSGLDDLDEEIIDAKTVIDGTEDDIRNEIQAAGGFGTESQVQAMALSRNKSLLKNYNNLVAMKEMKENHLNTMIGLADKDRQYADQKANQMMNFDMQVIEYKTKFINNARDQYNKQITTFGADGVYDMYKSSPQQLAYAEKIMGLPSGGLQKAAVQAATERAQQLAINTLDLESKRASIRASNASTDKIYSDINKEKSIANFTTPPVINSQTGRPDPRNQLAQVINSTGIKSDDKLKLTGAVVSALQGFAENNSDGNFAGTGPIRAGSLTISQRGQDNRTNLSALEGTVESWMTGASVSEDQQTRIKRDLIPREWNTDKQIRQKTNALAEYMMNYAAGTLASQGVNFIPQKIDFFSNPIIPGPDGDEYEIVK